MEIFYFTLKVNKLLRQQVQGFHTGVGISFRVPN